MQTSCYIMSHLDLRMSNTAQIELLNLPRAYRERYGTCFPVFPRLFICSHEHSHERIIIYCLVSRGDGMEHPSGAFNFTRGEEKRPPALLGSALLPPQEDKGWRLITRAMPLPLSARLSDFFPDLSQFHSFHRVSGIGFRLAPFCKYILLSARHPR